jgi:hypothetical protein
MNFSLQSNFEESKLFFFFYYYRKKYCIFCFVNSELVELMISSFPNMVVDILNNFTRCVASFNI